MARETAEMDLYLPTHVCNLNVKATDTSDLIDLQH